MKQSLCQFRKQFCGSDLAGFFRKSYERAKFLLDFSVQRSEKAHVRSTFKRPISLRAKGATRAGSSALLFSRVVRTQVEALAA